MASSDGFLLSVLLVCGFAVFSDGLNVCYNNLDWAIAIDASNNPTGGTASQNCQYIQSFVSVILSKFNVVPDGTHVGFVYYNNDSNILFGLDTPLTSNSGLNVGNMQGQIRGIACATNKRDVGAGLNSLISVFSSGAGARYGYRKAALLVMDSKANVKTGQTLKIASTLKGMGVEVYVVGVTNMVDQTECRSIASSDSNFFYVDTFAALDSYIDSVTSGICGSSGYTGASGPYSTGFTGPTGSPYSTGFTGATGSTGGSGFPGGPGATGATGASGAAGPLGSTGYRGSTGSMGATGMTGAPGPPGPGNGLGSTGATGSTGVSGVPGQPGYAGSTGAQGLPGNMGISGMTGATGQAGPPGPPGAPGSGSWTGATGATGQNGVSGPVGASGSTGSIGATGASGAPGVPGSTGSVGASGFMGVVGASGSYGATGMTGAGGFTGATGMAGPMGATGNAGGTGATGNAGSTGSTGVYGPMGAPGSIGSAGSPGPQGPQGPPGPPGQGVSVVDKCLTNNGGCQQICQNTPESYYCMCDKGYVPGPSSFSSSSCTVGVHSSTYFCQFFSDLRGIVLPYCFCRQSSYSIVPVNGTQCVDDNECSRNNGGCAQGCTNTYGSFQCTCKTGFTLASDRVSCNDIDECASSSPCPSGTQCMNSYGSYVCVSRCTTCGK